MTPLVTVCIPTYNNPDGLKRTLECITHQSYQNLRILISDNCSEDPWVQEVIWSYASDKRVCSYQQEINIGVDKNYSFLIDNTTSPYFMFAQDDDWWSRDYIRELVTALEANPESPVAICPTQYKTADGKLSELHDMKHLSLFSITGSGDTGFVCMGVWRTEAFRKCVVRLPVYVLGGDHVTVAQAMLGGGPITIVDSERYIKGYKEGRFGICFKNDFWYSFRSWYWLIKILVQSSHISFAKKLWIPLIAFPNLCRACAITGVQIVTTLPDNPLKAYLKKQFFGAN
jgi:glycosyltransferase involved in cell wall biosynthesis